jgi:hypothetical protein
MIQQPPSGSSPTLIKVSEEVTSNGYVPTVKPETAAKPSRFIGVKGERARAGRAAAEQAHDYQERRT